MKHSSSKRFAAAMVCGLLVGCGGGGDGGGGGGVTGNGTPTALFISPTAVNFGAVGSSKQVTTTYKDASNNVVNGTTVTFALSGTGASASVSATGLVTAIAPGQGVDTVVATGSGLTAKAPIFVVQVPASVTVTSPSGATPDTLFAAGRTRQFSATVKDSNNNAIAAPGTITWSSNAGVVASVVGTTGLVTAQADGSASIQALIGSLGGNRAIVVRRLPTTHTLTPPTASISVSGGSAGPFSASVTDSASQAIPVTWVSRNPFFFTVSSSTGSSINVNATGNGSAYLVTTIPAVAGGIDSSNITVTGQPTLPTTAAVSVGDDFFKSGHNGSCGGTGASTCTSGGANAVDTVAVGGTVTWTWGGSVSHSVQSTGSPSFTSSTVKTTGTYGVTFNTAGSYSYNCAIHGAAMTGIIVVK